MNAQVAITAVDIHRPDMAKLEIESTEKGLLIPRMTETRRDDDFCTNPAFALNVPKLSN